MRDGFRSFGSWVDTLNNVLMNVNPSVGMPRSDCCLSHLLLHRNEHVGVRPDDEDGIGYARRLLHAGVLLEDLKGGDVQRQVLQPHRPPQLGRHVMT